MADLQALFSAIMPESILSFLLALGIILLIAYFCYKATKALFLRYTSRSSARWAARLVGYMVFAVLIYAADHYILGLDLNATIASLGILSIAIAFASQQIISNLLAGFLMTVNRTIRLDDWIELGGNPRTGIAQVKDMTFTRTVMQDRDGRVFLVPNASLLSSKIVNYSKSGYIEIPVDIMLPLSVPFAQAQATILAVLAEHPDVLQNNPSPVYPGSSGMRESYFFQGYTGTKITSEHTGPRVLMTGMTHQAIAVSIRFWIADATRKEDIISVILAEVERKLGLSGRI